MLSFIYRFLDRSAAAAQKLTYVNDAGNAIMKVDNSSTISVGDKRNSIRIVSKDRVNVGSVWIADFLHVPYGVCFKSCVVGGALS